MRRNNIVFRAVACFIIVSALPTVLAFFAFGLPSQYNETYLCALQDKWTALENAEGRRIVITGGSGAAFGIRSDLLEDTIDGYSVVNFGLYAGLGTTVMLEIIRPLLKEGDIVIFSPEQSEQTLSDFFSAKSMWQAADGMPRLLTALNSDRIGKMAGEFPSFAGEKAGFYFKGDAPTGKGIYARSSFNSYGDIAGDRECNIMTDGVDPNMEIRFDKDTPTDDFFERVNSFTSSCKKDGIDVYYRFCPMNLKALPYREEEKLKDYSEYLADRLDCPIIGSAESAIMEAEWFFDTNFHLNSAGATVNTAILACELKEILKDDTPVNIDMPQKPSFKEADIVTGDNTDSDCFIYEENGEGLHITGLSDKGRTKSFLTVPVSKDGKNITGFSSDVFGKSATIREIKIQANIKAIEDFSFDGCEKLERIYIDNPSPESCTVGGHLLDRTKAFIIVSSEYLSTYKTNYFWSPYSVRIKAEDNKNFGSNAVSETETSVSNEKSDNTIIYMANGGKVKSGNDDQISLPLNNTHIRQNTAIGTRYFEREGYVITGWNTEADGSGISVGLGSRIQTSRGTVLYAMWAESLPESNFIYEVKDGAANITKYLGSTDICVVPEKLGGAPVRRICSGAFSDAEFAELILPSSLKVLEERAFESCSVSTLTLFDSLQNVHPDCFADCTELQTLHINSAVSPVYSGSYFDTFSDKYDRLLSLAGQQKLVLFSGSSGRYGYNSEAISAAFPSYQVVNMGVYAYTTALPQLDIIRDLTEEGDILLSAPEFDAAEKQFCTSNKLDAGFWAMTESNYDVLLHLDMREYSDVFSSLGEYLEGRIGMTGKSYSVTPASYDDDGNKYTFSTYNKYGDLILPRPNGKKDECLRHNIADYTVDNIPIEYVRSINKVYKSFTGKGVSVYFTYTPRNRHSLTERSTLSARAELDAYLRENLSVPVISSIESSLYPGTYFYLIDSHLTTEGAEIRTERVISDLKKQMSEDN